ncbi:threonine synthase [candidate division KSB1 bacterium]|nr:threonine synthase [candidate division KSB1 bacterium]
MKFYSTFKKCSPVTFREAVMKGLAADGGLFMPAEIPALPASFFQKLKSLTFQEIAFEVGHNLLKYELPAAKLQEIILSAFNFEAPIHSLTEQIHVLELFHGPTLAFKDFAARFMARLMAYFIAKSQQKMTILVATSGDTGSAVADGFFQMDGIQVFILYPAGKVSALQEKQLTTQGENIVALEIQGTFDDCQHIVKQSFMDHTLVEKLNLTSANSINIARLIPQSFYYFYAMAQLHTPLEPIIFSVPSGNFGNVTAGVIARKMGLPVAKFVAAVNANDGIPKYLKSGQYQAQPTRQTLSNAMDVGNPSNFARILDLYHHNPAKIREDFWSTSILDDEVRQTIREVYVQFNYILEPHGAVGYAALKRYLNESGRKNMAILLETAHPAKFWEVVHELIPASMTMPERLKKCQMLEKKSVLLPANFHLVKEFLLNYR